MQIIANQPLSAFLFQKSWFYFLIYKRIYLHLSHKWIAAYWNIWFISHIENQVLNHSNYWFACLKSTHLSDYFCDYKFYRMKNSAYLFEEFFSQKRSVKTIQHSDIKKFPLFYNQFKHVGFVKFFQKLFTESLRNRVVFSIY